MRILVLCIFMLVVVLAISMEADAKRGGGGRGSSGRGSSSRGSSSRGSSSKSKGSIWKSSKKPTKNYGSPTKTKKGWSNKKKAVVGGAVVGGVVAGTVLYKGRNVVGNYHSFGQPNRWSMYGGRSFYYVGYPHMYGHHHHYGHRRYHEHDDDDDDAPGLVNAWTVMVLVLVAINTAGLGAWTTTYCYLKHH